MINIVVAHHGEGKPFIDHYRLRAESSHGMTLYANATVRLLVTGQGADNVEKALAKMMAFREAAAQPWWINFGLAGSAQFPVGTLVTIDQAEWRHKESVQRVAFMTVPGLPVSGCVTRNQPSTDYPPGGVVDMEAAAIAGILDKTGNLDKTAIYKLVSDGPSRPVDSLTPAMARQCIEQHAIMICRACDDFIACQESREGITCERP